METAAIPPPGDDSDSSPNTAPEDGPIPPSVILLLAQTRRWVYLLYVLSLTCVVVGLGAVMMTSRSDLSSGAPGQTSRVLPVSAIAMLICIVAAVLLWRFVRDIRCVEQDRSLNALRDALSSQKSCWKFVSILVAIYFAINAIVLIRSALW